jgi:hypothetical protein
MISENPNEFSRNNFENFCQKKFSNLDCGAELLVDLSASRLRVSHLFPSVRRGVPIHRDR